MTSTRITIDVTFDPDAVIVQIAEDGDLSTLELLGALDVARDSLINPDTESIPT